MRAQGKSQVVGIRLSPDLVDELDKLANTYGESRADVIRNLLECGSELYPRVHEAAKRRRNNRDAQVETTTHELRLALLEGGASPRVTGMTLEVMKAAIKRLIDERVETQEDSQQDP